MIRKWKSVVKIFARFSALFILSHKQTFYVCLWGSNDVLFQNGSWLHLSFIHKEADYKLEDNGANSHRFTHWHTPHPTGEFNSLVGGK